MTYSPHPARQEYDAVCAEIKRLEILRRKLEYRIKHHPSGCDQADDERKWPMEVPVLDHPFFYEHVLLRAGPLDGSWMHIALLPFDENRFYGDDGSSAMYERAHEIAIVNECGGFHASIFQFVPGTEKDRDGT